MDNNPLPNDSENIYGSLISEESSIRLLSLRGNDIGDSGAATIAEGLKTNHSLVSLNLWGNKIGTNGVKALADVYYLRLGI